MIAERAPVSDRERRARMVRRHDLAGSAPDPTASVRSLVAMHSSDPLTPVLGAWARVAGFEPEMLDRALLGDRTLVRLHAMRRTLFLVPTDELGIFQGAAAREVARRERRQLEGWLAAEMSRGEVPRWLRRAEARVLEGLGEEGELRTAELTRRVPELAVRITMGSGKWSSRSPISSRLLFLMALEGRIVRTRALGSWRSSQYHWAVAADWFAGTAAAAMTPENARAELVRRYLRAFGPATLVDVRWWTGWSMTRAREALRAVGAVPVALEGEGKGWLLPEDLAEVERPSGDPVVTLLPGLDPTPMGWKERSWYLGPHEKALFDTNGNVGPTVWVDGRIVGGWAQRSDGRVVHRVLEEVGEEASQRIVAACDALTEWLDGVVAAPRFRTPLERAASSGPRPG